MIAFSRPEIPNYDVVIVGGGIVGTATARDLSNRNSTLKLAIVEKEQSVGKCFSLFVEHHKLSYFKLF